MSYESASRAIDCLVLDLFGVVIAFDDEIVCRRLACHSPSPEKALSVLRNIVSDADLIRGRKTLPQLHAELSETVRLRLDYAMFLSEWCEPYTAPMPGMAQLIERLSRNYRLVLLSNVDQYYWQRLLAWHPELALFDHRLLSWAMGMAKPQREVFERAIDAAAASPKRCLFVDDKPENVEASEGLGMRAHLFRGPGGFLAVLGELGVDVFAPAHRPTA